MPAIGWRGRQGLGDAANQFHYYRLTADDRILWGGYDAVYHYGSAVGAELDEQRPADVRAARRSTSSTTLPAAGGRALHATAGAARSTPAAASRVFFGTAHGGRVAYAARLHRPRRRRHAASAPRVALDLRRRPRHRADPAALVRSKPLPFPPEPLRWAGIQLTTRRAGARRPQAGPARALAARARPARPRLRLLRLPASRPPAPRARLLARARSRPAAPGARSPRPARTAARGIPAARLARSAAPRRRRSRRPRRARPPRHRGARHGATAISRARDGASSITGP